MLSGKELTRRDFLLKTKDFGEGVGALYLLAQFPYIPEFHSAENPLEPITKDGLITYGDRDPITQEQLETLMYQCNATFDSGETERDTCVIYSTEILSASLIERIEALSNHTYTDFLNIYYAYINSLLKMAGLPTKVVIRRVIRVTDAVQFPCGMDKEWAQRGPKDSQGGGSGPILKLYLDWLYFWSEDDMSKSVVPHELGHLLFCLPDNYWNDYPFSPTDPALAGVAQQWQSYQTGTRISDGVAGLMNTRWSRLDLNSCMLLARAEFSGKTMLPTSSNYSHGLLGFPNRFAERNVMQVSPEKTNQLVGCSVTVYRKIQKVVDSKVHPKTTDTIAFENRSIESEPSFYLERLDLGDVIVKTDGSFELPNVYHDLITSSQDLIHPFRSTLFIRFEKNSRLFGFMWMDSFDFSNATGVEETFPAEIELTVNPVLVEDMDTTRPEHHDWRIRHRPLDGYESGSYEVGDVRRTLVERFPTTGITSAIPDIEPEPTATPTATPTAIVQTPPQLFIPQVTR